MRLRLWQRPALRWKSRSLPAPSTHALADVVPKDSMCLTWSEAVVLVSPTGFEPALPP
jgi:hypothetical protein